MHSAATVHLSEAQPNRSAHTISRRPFLLVTPTSSFARAARALDPASSWIVKDKYRDEFRLPPS
jgi:hypothetical protein